MKNGKAGRSTHARTPGVMSTWLRTDRKRAAVPVGVAEKEQVLDEALDEYVRLQEEGVQVSPSKFCQRYPTYRRSLQKLIDVHNAMEGVEAPIEPPQWPEVASEFLGFQILGELGVGAFARVFLGAETALGGRLVAVKVSQHGGCEAETLGKLSHPNIVPVHSVQYDPATEMTAVCMPYLGNATLEDLLDLAFEDGKPPQSAKMIVESACRRSNLVGYVDARDNARRPTGGQQNGHAASDEPEVDAVLERGSYVDGVVHLGIQIASALEYTHKRGILHRDLKPSNVLLTPEGVPKLLDFNLATDADHELPKVGGTLAYMPSEQIEDVHLRPYAADLSGDPRSDIFSLGVILYELLTGQFPFGEPPVHPKPKEAAKAYLKAQKQAPRPISELNPAVDRHLAHTIKRCLATQMADRPQSAPKLVVELQEHFTRKARARRRRFVAAWTTLAVGFTGPVALYFATRPPPGVRAIRAAITALRQSDAVTAIRRIDDAILIFGKSSDFALAKGVAYQLANEHENALDEFDPFLQDTQDALFLECAAYSALHSKIPERYKQANTLLGRLEGELSAEVLLNHAVAAYRAGRPLRAFQLAKQVLERRHEWDKAHYVCGLTAIQAVNKKTPLFDGTAQQKKVYTRDEALDIAISHFEQAIALSGGEPRLYYDTIDAYARANPDEPTDRLRALIALAVDAGASAGEIQTHVHNTKWQGQEWLNEIVSRAPEHGRTGDANMTYFLTRPRYGRLHEKLERFIAKATAAP